MTNKSIVLAAVAAVSGLGIITLGGCGGGNSGGGGGGNTSPSISGFSSSPAIVTDGATAKLTATFANGTGVITPGNTSVTSGTAVSVTPPNDATTTYTLTVTGTSGATVTATTTAQAVAAPAITSFAASPVSIVAGANTNLTAVFTGGTGMITPGNLAIVSGTPLPISPTTTTTYTLTVTNAATTAVTQTATVTVTAAPAITSFTAKPTTVTDGSTSSLTAVFTGGTGLVTPGNTPIVSGTPVTVTPPNDATTTYTLTVTGASGTTPQTTTATVQAVAAPAITSFSANPTSISSGGTSNLTAVFTGGTGAITAGTTSVSSSVTSGSAVPVTPTSTTTYTLSVTNAADTVVTSTATITVITATVTVNPAVPGIAVTDQLLGMNMAAWYDNIGNAGTILPAFNGAGIKAIRWPGGSWSDGYHWGYQTGSSTLVPAYQCACSSPTSCTANSSNWAGTGTFAQFVSAVPLAGPFDLALTANYGTDETCSKGGDPKEAAAWAAAAVADGITPSHITVGNEEYGSWETDLHSTPNDPTIYANSVIGAGGYYSLIKAQSPSTQVGVIVDANATNGCCTTGWDTTVLGTAAGSYDFVEFHYYPQNPGGESDSYLVTQAAQDFTNNIKTIRDELTAASEPNTPIYVGEMGSVSSNPGIESWSITQGLFAGQMLGEMMNDGVTRATWWIGFGNCNGIAGAPWDQISSASTSGFYGWQDFGAYNVFADPAGDVGGGTSGPPAYPNTPCNYGGPVGTMSPTAEAFNLFQHVAVTGEHVLTPSVTGDSTDVHAYAATHSGGTAIVLFNLNETTSESITVKVDGVSNSSDVKVITYDKSIYDLTNAATPVWAPPTTTDLGNQTLPLNVTLAPWSMNVILVQ